VGAILSQTAGQIPRRIGYWRVDSGLDHYLSPLLAQRWPKLRIERYRDASVLSRLLLDVWVCGEDPPLVPVSPTLILGAIAAQPSVDQIAEKVWRLATPITGRRLVADIQRLLLDPKPR
jgi:hypothetical protein